MKPMQGSALAEYSWIQRANMLGFWHVLRNYLLFDEKYNAYRNTHHTFDELDWEKLAKHSKMSVTLCQKAYKRLYELGYIRDFRKLATLIKPKALYQHTLQFLDPKAVNIEYSEFLHIERRWGKFSKDFEEALLKHNAGNQDLNRTKKTLVKATKSPNQEVSSRANNLLFKIARRIWKKKGYSIGLFSCRGVARMFGVSKSSGYRILQRVGTSRHVVLEKTNLTIAQAILSYKYQLRLFYKFINNEVYIVKGTSVRFDF